MFFAIKILQSPWTVHIQANATLFGQKKFTLQIVTFSVGIKQWIKAVLSVAKIKVFCCNLLDGVQKNGIFMKKISPKS